MKELEVMKRHITITDNPHLNLTAIQDLLLKIDLGDKCPEQIILSWEQQCRVGMKSWSLSTKSISSLIPDISFISEISLSIEERNYLLHYYRIRCFYEEIIQLSGSDTFIPSLFWNSLSGGKIGVARYDGLHLIAGPNLFAVQTPNNSYLVSRDHLLIIADLSSQRYMLRLYSILDSKIPSPSFLSTYDLDTLFDLGDEILKKGGDPAYKLIYGLEPMIVSSLVGNIPVGKAGNPTFHQNILKDQKALATKLNILSEWGKWYDFIIKQERPITMKSQIYGMYRLWGHPTVDPILGAMAMRKIATTFRYPDQKYIDKINCRFKEEFIIRYHKKHGVWPEVDVSLLSPQNIIRKSYEEMCVLPIRHRRYRREHLILIKFKQNLVVDPKFDLLELLSDKALSLPTPDLINSILTKHHPGSSLDRSVLLNWLSSYLHDPVSFLRTIDEEGFPENERSIGLKEKEREGKTDPRLFGLTTLHKRMYIVLTEALIAEHVLQYFPEITMADDELSLDKIQRSQIVHKCRLRKMEHQHERT